MSVATQVDKRMLQEDVYITDEKVLLRVSTARWLGKMPDRRLVVTAEDCVTDARRTLTGSEMLRFRYVEPCADAAAAELELAIA